MSASVMVKFPSGVGRAGCPGNGKIILSAAEIKENGRNSAFEIVRLQWWNSKNRPTAGAYIDLPAADMVEFAVALLQVSVETKPALRNELFGQLARIAALCQTD